MTDSVDTRALDAASALDEAPQDEAAPSHRDNTVHIPEDNWYGGLKLISTLELDGASSEDGYPDIDVVHVTGMFGEEQKLRIHSIINFKTLCREFMFICNVAHFLLGDFTREAIETVALRLLDSLVRLEDKDTSERTRPPNRAIVFVAYDLGAVILKKALSIASRDIYKWPDRCRNSARVIFYGAPQRSDSLRVMEAKLFQFLRDREADSWRNMLTPSSIRRLAQATLGSTEEFLSSKFTLRGSIMSLYAHAESPRSINPVFDEATATLGVPREISLREQGQDDDDAFPTLATKMCQYVEYWVAKPDWVRVEEALLSMSAPPGRFKTIKRLNFHPTVNDKHDIWVKERGHSLMYIHGTNRAAVTSAAEQLIAVWKEDQKERFSSPYDVWSFTFSSKDPLRNSASCMALSLITRDLISSRDDILYLLVEDQFRLQNGWGEQEALKWLMCGWWPSTRAGVCVLLQDFDECDEQSRDAFLKLFKLKAEGREDTLKLLVTSRVPSALTSELNGCAELNIDRTDTDIPKPPVSGNEVANPGASPHDPVDSLAYLCPTSTYGARLTKALKQLEAMGADRSGHLLELAQKHSAWSEEPSTSSLTKFLDLIECVSPSTTGADIVARIMNTLPNVGAARWILKWLLNSQRPLLIGELATILYLQPKEGTIMSSETTLGDIIQAIDNISDWFRGLIDINCDQVLVRDFVWSMLKDNKGVEQHFLTDIGDQAHSSILDFCFNYLGDSNVQRRAISNYEPYLARVQAAGDSIYPPMISNGRDPLSYIVMAFPHHLSRAPGGRGKLSGLLLKDQNGPLELWSKLWWAMSSPLTRPRRPCPSAYLTLAGLGLADYRQPLISNEERWGILVQAARNNNKEIVIDLLRTEKDCPLSTLTDALEGATKAGSEEMALSIMAKVLPHRQQAVQQQPLEARVNTPWPPCLLWRATWLNMTDLMESLLNNDMEADPKGIFGRLFPSPLYMASRVGNAAAVDMLLEAGADTAVLRADKYSSLIAAAGHIEVINILVPKARKLLEMGQLYRPLGIATVDAEWRAATALLDLGADPDVGIKPNDDVEYGFWAPLCSAASWGHIKTVQALLEHGADANVQGPWNQDTPLWFATIGSASVPCCRALLDHKADPNHKLLSPPLMIDLVNSERSSEEVIAVSELLVSHRPPIDVEKADSAGRTALMHASRSSDPALVKWLLEHGAYANSVDDKGWTPLFHATEAGRLETVEELLQSKWKPNLMLTAPKEGGKSLLQVAFEAGNNQLIKRLLEAGADPELELVDRLTLINVATKAGETEVVKMLIEHKVDLDHADRFGWTPMCEVVGYKPNAKIARLLVDAGANVGHIMENSGRNLMHLAMGQGDPEVIRILFEFPKAIDIDHCDNWGYTPLFCGQKPEAVRLLIRAGANFNAQNSKGVTPLIYAIENKAPLETVDLYLSQPQLDLAVCSKSVGSALHMACRMLNGDAVNKLVAQGADVNLQAPVVGSSPLISACAPVYWMTAEQRGSVDEIVSVLLGAGADVNAVAAGARYTFCTALSAAAFWAKPSTIKMLLDHGADAGLQDRLGRQAIHFAAANGADNLRAVLGGHQGSVAVADCFGKTALHWAAQLGRLKALEMLLLAMDRRERLRCVDEPDVDGWTPLCWAMRIFTIESMSFVGKGSDYKGVVQCLLNNGADPHVQCHVRQGEEQETFTLLQLAHLYNVDDCIMAVVRDSLNGQTGASAAQSKTEEAATKQYTRSDLICDVCFCQIYGLGYACSACDDFDVCKKCYGRIDDYHGSFEGDEGAMHTFSARTDRDEFVQASELAPKPKIAEDTTDIEQRGEEGVSVNPADSRTGQPESTKEGDEDNNNEDDEEGWGNQVEEDFDFFTRP
ncbi:hypothetical protein KVR01_011577 [Diaporthe batatas]|uniref:uncharacterized protein n=1 Tax=Diaporthe batatas TaxID=748121 RepID=UPI001D039AC6|nr:uncharacterized protein KVR01_011577 [Diaporthe batatas]KAG8158455.1 hypothetical protein KVR01_011577 [Diaporthe batatas]